MLMMMSGGGVCINHKESCGDLYSPQTVCTFTLGSFWHCIYFLFFLCASSRFLSRVADTRIHVRADLSYSTDSFIANGWGIHIFLSQLNPKQCDSSGGRCFYRECCKAETSPCHPAVSMAAAGKSNYSVGSPLGITQSVSERPEVNDSCLPWTPGSQSLCRIKITWPVQHLLALDTCKIALL